MKSIKWISLILGILPTVGLATPAKYSLCQNVTVNHVKGNNGTFFDEDCRRLYVVPPKTGSLKVMNFNPSTTLDKDCQRLDNLLDEEAVYSELKKMKAERLLAMEKEISELERNLRDGLLPIGKTVEDVEDRIDGLMEKIAKQRGDIRKWEAEATADRLPFAQRYGAKGDFLIEDQYGQMIEKYQEANPKLQIARLPLDQGFLSINEKTYNADMDYQMPAVLSLQLIGLNELPLLAPPSLTIEDKNYVPWKAPNGSKIFGGALGGEIIFSQIGACSIQAAPGGKEDFLMSDIKGYIVPSATYTYQVQVQRRHSLTFNMKEFVRLVHQQVKKGGLFSRKTLNSLIDDRSFGTWIEFHVESGDMRFEYTDEYIKEVKKEFLDRALAQIVSVKTGSPAALLSLIDPKGPNGADAIAEGLSVCPHLYCQIGSAGFKVLSTIFGSEKATSELIKNLTGEYTEVMTEKKMIPQYGTASFE